MASYYRRFVKDYVKAKPQMDIQKDQNGTVSKHMSQKVPVEFDESQRDAFEHLRNILASEDVIIM